MDKEQFLTHLKEGTKVFQNEAIEKAFRAIDRADFVPADYQIEAYEDYALPLGFGQTMSQPSTVAFMLELLEPKNGDWVLDVGSGSGFSTALLSHVVGKSGKVIGVEIVPELVKFGQTNLAKYKLPQAKIISGKDLEIGFPEEAPYNRILVSAEAELISEELLNQLKIGGIMVMPVNHELVQIRKTSETEIETEEFPGFSFVPLIY
ncbi:MAG: protein-L-isoaspartate O-methyltransferase [Candidatus Paceibacterota bacterium]|jgi:protein-L-isoaspartate(D-aspartate) O-methyltransferase